MWNSIYCFLFFHQPPFLKDKSHSAEGWEGHLFSPQVSRAAGIFGGAEGSTPEDTENLVFWLSCSLEAKTITWEICLFWGLEENVINEISVPWMEKSDKFLFYQLLVAFNSKWQHFKSITPCWSSVIYISSYSNISYL